MNTNEVLRTLLIKLRPWVQDVHNDVPMNGGDLVDDLCDWVHTKDVSVGNLDDLIESLRL